MGVKIYGPNEPGKLEHQTKTSDLVIDAQGRASIKSAGSAGDSPYAFESIDVDNTIKQLTAGTYDDATSATIMVEDAEVRVTLDGTDPSTTVGMLFYVGDTIELTSAAEIAGFKVTRATGTNAKITAHYGK